MNSNEISNFMLQNTMTFISRDQSNISENFKFGGRIMRNSEEKDIIMGQLMQWYLTGDDIFSNHVENK